MEGISVRLADGKTWTLSVGDRIQNDPEFDALLTAAMNVEDQAEALRAELAVTIFLLRRNYDLSPDQLALLLTFSTDDPDLSELQNAVHDLVVERINRIRDPEQAPAKDDLAPEPTEPLPDSM